MAIAKRSGKSPHAFMVQAIEQQTADAELRAAFVKDALNAEKEAVASGKGFGLEEVRALVEARARGEKARRPRARAWRK
ncbi:MAG: hypothetical protein M3Y59_24605 [Myxococcota bacterium]|nr:hypothetical protein [Myxococcota bacterium]